jgi:hypothetical protein
MEVRGLCRPTQFATLFSDRPNVPRIYTQPHTQRAFHLIASPPAFVFIRVHLWPFPSPSEI